MPDLRPIFYVNGVLIGLLGMAMLAPMLVDLVAGHRDWEIFGVAAVLTSGLGAMLAFANRGSGESLRVRQAFLLTVAAWILLPAVAALPFTFSELRLSYTDAYFEAMSGLSTTGSTVIIGLDAAPPGILIWRAILQWMGGIGIVVMAVAILPMLQVGGMQLFRMESSDTSEKILPRAAQISGAITALYIALTACCAVLLSAVGFPVFDAVAHAMTTIATGGFSTKDGSVGHFDIWQADAIITGFMILGSLPFVLYLQAMRGGVMRPILLWRDEQARHFLILIALLIGLGGLWLMQFKGLEAADAFRYGAFNMISIITGTGYATTDYGQWGSFALTLFFLLMFIGGCAGSTSCGIKIFRFQVLFKSMTVWLKRSVTPHGVFMPRYNGQVLKPDVRASVITFLIFFLVVFFVLAFLLALTGLDWITAMSGAGTALSNVGPGLGPVIGPAGNFASLPDISKWLLSIGMLMGRLELFTVLVLFSPSFWIR